MLRIFFRRFLMGCIVLMALTTALAQLNVAGSGTRSFQLQPGDTFRERVVVSNNSAETVAMHLYFTDYLFQANGSNRFDPPGSHARSNAAWMELLGRDRYEIPAGGEIGIEILGTVPNDADLVGSFWSTLMVEERRLDEGEPGQAGVGIRVVQRRAIQIITDLGGGAAELGFDRPQMATDESTGALQLSLDLRNDGTRHSRPSTRLELLDADTGQPVLAVDGRQSLVYPGTSVRLSFEIGQLEPGLYQAFVLADGGGTEVFGIRYGLDLREED